MEVIMLNINTKQFSIITFLIVYIFFIPHILTPSLAQETEKSSPMDLEVLLGETTATPREMSGGLKFQYEMAELLGERVGPDDSGNVHHAGDSGRNVGAEQTKETQVQGLLGTT